MLYSATDRGRRQAEKKAAGFGSSFIDVHLKDARTKLRSRCSVTSQNGCERILPLYVVAEKVCFRKKKERSFEGFCEEEGEISPAGSLSKRDEYAHNPVRNRALRGVAKRLPQDVAGRIARGPF